MAEDKYEKIGQLPAEVPTVGAFLSAVAMAGIRADSEAKDAARDRLVALTTADEDGQIPMLNINAGMHIPGALANTADDLDLGVAWQVPALVIEPDRILCPSEINASWDMSVHSSATDSSDLQAQVSGTGEAKVGWGPFSASVKIEASASTSESKKRETDDTATLHADMKMVQLPVSEGQALILSSCRQIMTRGMDIVDKLAQAAADKVAREAKVAIPTDSGSEPSPDQPNG